MTAELSNGMRMVRFSWNCGGLTRYEVKIYKFDANESPESLYDEIMTRIYAKGYWDKLIRQGYKRVFKPGEFNPHCPDLFLEQS